MLCECVKFSSNFFIMCRHRLGTLNSVLRSFLRRGKVTRDRISMSAVMEDDVSCM